MVRRRKGAHLSFVAAALCVTAFVGPLVSSIVVVPPAFATSGCSLNPQGSVVANDAYLGTVFHDAIGNRQSVWIVTSVNDYCLRVSSVAILMYNSSTDAQAEVGVEESSHGDQYCDGQNYNAPRLFVFWITKFSSTFNCTQGGSPGVSDQYRNLTIQSITTPGVFTGFLGINPPVTIAATTQLGFTEGFPVNNGERHYSGDSEYSQFAAEKWAPSGSTTYIPWTDPQYRYETPGNNYHCVYKAVDSNYDQLATRTC